MDQHSKAELIRTYRLASSPVQDAREVLPKGLLAKLRRYCTGLVYVPAPPRDNVRREMVLRLHASGMSVKNIARATRFSAKWVRHIVQCTDSKRSPKSASKSPRLVPQDIVQQVQQHM